MSYCSFSCRLTWRQAAELGENCILRRTAASVVDRHATREQTRVGSHTTDMLQDSSHGWQPHDRQHTRVGSHTTDMLQDSTQGLAATRQTCYKTAHKGWQPHDRHATRQQTRVGSHTTDMLQDSSHR